jgi:sulfite reductase alpha subunit-like flavoprotein
VTLFIQLWSNVDRSKVFGLGNKTYEHYNAVGKYVDKRLDELGGVRVCELGLGDDDGKYVTLLMDSESASFVQH